MQPFIAKTEQTMGKARPDVVVSGRGFLLAIEIKRSIGTETTVQGKPQTVRLVEGLLEHAKKRGIANAGALAILLAPNNLQPADKRVVAVSMKKLFKRVEQRVRKRLLSSFMDLLTRG
jgi:Holliday junction resolvase